MNQEQWVLPFQKIGSKDLPEVGGKNASLGEMYNQLKTEGIQIPDGFALTAGAYRQFIQMNNLGKPLAVLLQTIDKKEYSNLAEVGEQARKMILTGNLPEDIRESLTKAYYTLSESCGSKEIDVAVRSSATAEDLPSASFAGRMESFLNICGEDALMDAVLRCYASLYTDRAIKYRFDKGFADTDIAISVGVQQMVRSDLASSGVAFTLDPDSGFENVVVITGCWGLGDNIVQGRVTPDEWIIFKPTAILPQYNPILKKRCGKKEYTLVYSQENVNKSVNTTIQNQETEPAKQAALTLSDDEVILLAKQCLKIETHYRKPMDIEWAKDGRTGIIYIVQARPETVHSLKKKQTWETYTLAPGMQNAPVLARGTALGNKITTGIARIIKTPAEGKKLQPGEILVTEMTNPDWDPLLKKASAIITDKGGRTSHAAIVARELGTVSVVGCGNATEKIRNGQQITVSCAEGKEGIIYDGQLSWNIKEEDFTRLPATKVRPMLILADPEKAFGLSKLPNDGVGLMRLEFAITHSIKIHPLVLISPEKVTDPETQQSIIVLTKEYGSGKEYFIHKLTEAVSQVAAAFYPKDVIVRMSDFKSNEYANLIGGTFVEPHEENPMIGLRGASRYYSDFYREGFALECEAMKKVRNEMGLTNVKLMIPFCRTPEEGQQVLNEMKTNGLVRKENGLEIYVMVEIPSNALLADEFARLFDGFSIGSNDLTQLTLGLDRDSHLLSHLFNEENAAVKGLIQETIKAAKRNGIKVGLCGQAPSDIPEFAAFLVREGIDSISFNPDALFRGIQNMAEAEKEGKRYIFPGSNFRETVIRKLQQRQK
jgi:pyruvate,water dikinase